MAIVSHQTTDDSPQADGRRYLVHEYMDHIGKKRKIGPFLVPPAFDADADRIAKISDVEDNLAKEEVNVAITGVYSGISPDKVPDYQVQAEFDRRVLGRMMLVEDAHAFYAAYSMFQAVEGRGGANAGQRAVYLGIAKATYDLIAARFTSVSGVAWFLADEKAQVWAELPEDIS